MENIILVIPSKEHEQPAKEFIQEFIDNGSQLHGTGELDSQIDNYSEWLQTVYDYSKGIKLPAGYAPASTYFAIRESDKKIIGMLNIRHELNDYLLKAAGHLGNCVRPTERKKGYATQILYLGLEKCQELGIDKVLVVCDKTNIGSAKQIQNNFGILENEFIDHKKRTLQRYWIDVEYAIKNKKSTETNKAL